MNLEDFHKGLAQSIIHYIKITYVCILEGWNKLQFINNFTTMMHNVAAIHGNNKMSTTQSLRKH